MLEILAKEVKLGNQPNDNFKPSSFTRVTEAIKGKSGGECSGDHVENHFRTLQMIWSIIVAIRTRSGFGWNESIYMFTASPNVHHDYVQLSRPPYRALTGPRSGRHRWDRHRRHVLCS
ncbi:hypothetical protein ACH5RR_029313 [Cinchona calisaya]|uniref:Myb/SANT-like domain-containing protein n=1 Tax=Cinchona calisaya TaxID=153742 RepID=A0ABD2YVR2_9GENT